MTPELILKFALLITACLLSWTASCYFTFSSIVFLEQQKQAASYFKRFFFYFGFTFITFAFLELTQHPVVSFITSLLYIVSFYFLKLGFACRNGKKENLIKQVKAEFKWALVIVIVLNFFFFYYVWESRLARTLVLISLALYFCITTLSLLKKGAITLTAGEKATKVSIITSILFMEGLIVLLLLYGESIFYFSFLMVTQSIIVLLFFGATLIIFLSDASLRYQKESITDFLTGLYNRRYFHDRLKQIIHTSQRHLSPVTLILLDIDHFKLVNDNYGHDIGDQVLKGVSKIIQDTLRVSDIAARYGGEEICLLLPHTSIDGAKLLAERIRVNIEQETFDANGKSFSITASFGVAKVEMSSTPDNVLITADKALYESKENGRNRVTVADV